MIPKDKTEAVKRLVNYRPFFEKIKPEDVCRWEKDEATEGSAPSVYPVYAEDLLIPLEVAYDGDLLLPNYPGIIANAAGGETELADIVERLDKASYELVMAVFTCIVRQERFMPGLWEEAVRERWFYQILGRLQEMLEE